MNKRLAVLNNYPLKRVWNEVRLGETPDHLLFGINYFSNAGFDCTILPTDNSAKVPLLYRLLKKLYFLQELGHLGQQSYIVNNKHNYDLIYAPCSGQTEWLQYLRYQGKFDLPIISLRHHHLAKGHLDIFRQRHRRNVCHGLDASLCLSQFVANDLTEKTGVHAKTISWGTDIDFYQPEVNPGEGLVVAGRTARDFSTVIRALSGSSIQAKILYLKGHLGYEGETPKNLHLLASPEVEPVPGKNEGWRKVRDILDIYRKARVIGIPLYNQSTLAGLTSLMDCLGMGKPVIMTRNPNMDLDIEKEGIGYWVNPGDVESWRKHLDWFDRNPEQAVIMGKRARSLAVNYYNSKRFAEEMISIFNESCTPKQSW